MKNVTPQQGVQGDAVPLPEREVSSLPSLFPRLPPQVAPAGGAGGRSPLAGARGVLASFSFSPLAAAGGTRKTPEKLLKNIEISISAIGLIMQHQSTRGTRARISATTS